MAFQFNLNSVLELRKTESDQLTSLLETHKKKLDDLKTMLENEKECYFNERDQINEDLLLNRLDRIAMFENSLELRKSWMLRLLESIRSVEDDVQHYSIALKQSKRNVKILEKLRDKQYEDFMNEENKREQRILDEHANTQFIHRHNFESQKP